MVPLSEVGHGQLSIDHIRFSVSEDSDGFGGTEYDIVLRIRVNYRWRLVGSISITPNGGKWFETHVVVRPLYRGKGFGVLLYSYAADFAFNKGFKLTSTRNPSVAAEAVWTSKRLRKYYNVQRTAGRYHIRSRS